MFDFVFRCFWVSVYTDTLIFYNATKDDDNDDDDDDVDAFRDVSMSTGYIDNVYSSETSQHG